MFDQHVHSSFSFDSNENLENYINVSNNSDIITTEHLDFENPLSVLRHLKYTGVTGFQRAPFSKIKSFKDNCLTYEVAYFICQK